MATKKTENVFRDQLLRSLKENFGRKVHTHINHGSSMSAGLPDLFVQYNPLGAVHLELKADGEDYAKARTKWGDRYNGPLWDWGSNPTKLQQSSLRSIHNAGGRVGVLLYVKSFDVVCGVYGSALIRLFDERVVWKFQEVRHGYLTLAREFTRRWWRGGPKDERELLELCFGARLYSTTQTQESYDSERACGSIQVEV